MALDALCRSYWYPLYAYLRRSGKPPHDAEDLVQGFFANLLDGRLLTSAAPQRGRFRSLLLGALKNFTIDQHRATQAARRGGGADLVPLDVAMAEERWQADGSRAVSPDLVFDRAWAAETLAAAGVRLRAEFERAGRLTLFEAIWPRLSGVSGAEGNEAIAQRLDMTPGAVAAVATRLRDRYAAAIRAEIAQMVESDEEIEEEIRQLLALFS